MAVIDKGQLHCRVEHEFEVPPQRRPSRSTASPRTRMLRSIRRIGPPEAGPFFRRCG